MKIAGAFAAALLAFCSFGTAHAETIKIGVVLPFRGANADLGHQIDKAFDLYVKLHAKDIAPNKIELIKRDEGPPIGRRRQDRRHRTHHQRQGASCSPALCSRRRRSRWRRS